MRCCRSWLAILVAGSTAFSTSCSCAQSPDGRAASQVAARQILQSVLSNNTETGIGGGLATQLSELVDRPLEEKLARAFVVVHPGREDAELLRLMIWDGTESLQAFFRLDEDHLSSFLKDSIAISSLTMAEAKNEQIELGRNNDITPETATRIVHVASLLKSAKEWNELLGIESQLKAKVMSVLAQNRELAKPFERRHSDQLLKSRTRVVELIEQAKKTAK